MIESGTLLQDRFLIEGRIGEGGMGAVYLAVDQKFGSRVAVKQTFFGDAELAEAFEREARLLNGLHHPIFPHVSDHFSEDGEHFLVMEYIEGEDMSALLKQGKVFAVEEVMGWTLDLLDGLDYLHSQDPPVIHRDIKPNNLKLTSRGNIVLLDFGMAKETSGNTLGMRSVFGYSRRYSPLEQIEGTGTDHRSDIFSLGATVFHLLTGNPPVDVLARASAIVSGRPDPLEPANADRPDVPEPIAAILNSALALNPDQRFVSARAMWSALEYALGRDFAQEQAAPEPRGVEPLAFVPAAGEFPALNAYKAEGGNDTHDPSHEAAPVAPVLPTPNEYLAAPPYDGSETMKFRDVDPDTVQQVTPLQDDEAPPDSALIQLGTIDAQDDLPEMPGPEDENNAPAKIEIPVAAAAPLAVRPSINRRLGSTGVLWLTLLLALLSGLVVFGVFGTSADKPAVQESPVELAAQESPTGSETAAAVETLPEAEAAEVPEVDATSGEVASADESRTDEEVQAAVEIEEPEADVEPKASARTRTSRQDRDNREVEAVNEPEPLRTETRRGQLGPARRAPQRQAARRSGPERPRIVDVIEGPPVVSIETILTGSPYERRRRWRGGWDDDEDEFRRRRMRQIRRENRRAFPF